MPDPQPPPTPPYLHTPVLPQAVLTGLALKPGGLYLDATVGGGGHSGLILAAEPTAQLLGIDQDEVAIASAQTHLADYRDRVQFWRGNFADYNPGDQRYDGILADLGVSSPQVDTPERGFSFRHDAPLDMRMDQRQDLTAADIINHWDEKQLADIFFHYGEERLSRRIAREIVAQRPIHTTTELATVISRSVPGKYRHGRIHPATRTFQGLRIAVNRELDVLERLITTAPTWLKPGGRLVIISFHSLEDRRVKHGLKGNPDLTILTKKPVIAEPEEVRQNVRSRSAKLRVAERKIVENPHPAG